MRSHKSAVSVLNLAPDERSFLSGSWDKSIYDWDLNSGQIKRTYAGSSGQISSIELRPESSLPVQREEDGGFESTTLSTNTISHLSSANTHELPAKDSGDSSTIAPDNIKDSSGDSPDFESLFGDDDRNPLDDNFGLGDDEEFDPFSRAAEEQAQGDLPNLDADVAAPPDIPDGPSRNQEAPSSSTLLKYEQANGLQEAPMMDAPRASSETPAAAVIGRSSPFTAPPTAILASETHSTSESTFLSSSFDGTIRIWDRRMPDPIARLTPPRGTPPWCMSACWSPDGNKIYAGRRNNTVDEYSLLGGLRTPTRTFHFPDGSKAVSAVRAMPNGRHLICASFDILRLYDLQSEAANGAGRHGHGHGGVVPFLIVPGHRTGMVSQLYLDPTCRFMISTGGDRGWEGRNTEVLLGYEIGCMKE
jgi:transcriptional activator SPT8